MHCDKNKIGQRARFINQMVFLHVLLLFFVQSKNISIYTLVNEACGTHDSEEQFDSAAKFDRDAKTHIALSLDILQHQWKCLK